MLRLKNLLRSSSNLDLPLAVRLGACDISRAEIAGLEQVVLEDPKSIRLRRKVHLRAVLLEQAVHAMEGKADEDRLARVSIISSERSVLQAHSRATTAA